MVIRRPQRELTPDIVCHIGQICPWSSAKRMAARSTVRMRLTMTWHRAATAAGLYPHDFRRSAIGNPGAARSVPDPCAPTTATQAKLAKDFRNPIHPGRAARLEQKCQRPDALSALAALEHVVRDLEFY
jgi:hypothetical protein